MADLHRTGDPRLFRLTPIPSTSDASVEPVRYAFRPLAEPANDKPLEIPNCVSIEINEPRRVLAVVRKCIYCGATTFEPGSSDRLAEEHFIAEGLGSRFVLAEASCKACADLTKAFETNVLRGALHAPRRRLNIRGKKRQRNEPKYPIRIVNPDGTETTEWRFLDEHPTVLFLPSLDAPGLLTGRPQDQGGRFNLWAILLGDLRREARSFSSPVIDTVALCQLIAKIAHGFAVWQFGLDGFTPLLLDLILRGHEGDGSLSRYHIIGGDLRSFAPTNFLHVLGWTICPKDDKEYLLVASRLFSYLGGPMYFAVVGELNAEQSARARTVSEAHERSSRKHQGASGGW